jgi:uncharacterized protein
MGTEEPLATSEMRSGLSLPDSGEPLLLQIRSDRRLGHEWDDWDGSPLPDDGVFQERETLFFQLAAAAVLIASAGAFALVWLVGPRLDSVWEPFGGVLRGTVLTGATVSLLWLAAVAVVVRTGRNWLPARLAERGLVPWLMPKLERLGVIVGLSRDRIGNAAVRVFNRLSAARAGLGIRPQDLLILLPRCLGKEAMRAAMSVSSKYGVPVFVAARGRYARQMIAMRRPKGIVAVACERDLVSGIHDVAKKLPVLGTTLQLGDGPCRNTAYATADLEKQVRWMLGLGENPPDAAVRPE